MTEFLRPVVLMVLLIICWIFLENSSSPSAERTDEIADPDSSNLFPPDSSYHHRQAQGKKSGPRLSRVRPREEASRCRGATPRERWLVPYKDGILYGESWTARVTPRVRGSGPDDERISHNRKGECWTARVPWPAAGTTTTRRYTLPGSPSPPPRTTGRRTGRSTRCQGPPPCTSPRPVSPVAAAARSTTANFDHEMALTSAGCSPTELSSEPRLPPAGLNPAAAAIQSVRGEGSKES